MFSKREIFIFFEMFSKFYQIPIFFKKKKTFWIKNISKNYC